MFFQLGEMDDDGGRALAMAVIVTDTDYVYIQSIVWLRQLFKFLLNPISHLVSVYMQLKNKQTEGRALPFSSLEGKLSLYTILISG